MAFGTFLKIVFLGFEGDDRIPEFQGLLFQGFNTYKVQRLATLDGVMEPTYYRYPTKAIDFQRLDTEGERNFLFFFELLFGFQQVVTSGFDVGELVKKGNTVNL